MCRGRESGCLQINDIYMKKVLRKTQRFDSLNISLASPEEILSWSFGEVTKPETIHYRTQRLEPDGLFCEKIFGPENDFQCRCGKYKGMQYQGIECSNCGVEVTRALVRRERMGHIDLAVPIAHYWYAWKVPSRVATLLGLPTQQVQNVIYFSAYYITEVDLERKKKVAVEVKKELEAKMKEATQEETRTMLTALYADRIRDLDFLQKGTIIEEVKYEVLHKQYPTVFKAEKGGEVIYNLLKEFDLKKKEKEVLRDLESANKMQMEKLQKQLILIRSFIQSGNRPEWMFLTRLPVIPPGIRPVLMLDSGQPASSDLNDLYRAVIIRNNRLKDFIATKTPQIFINTEKRLLQEAVDALFEKSAAGRNTFSAPGGRGQASRQLKPLSEYLGGKTGYFRTNLLGKRVDFTGRTVIVSGSHLKLDECGLPKKMALEIFRPFVIGEALERELAYNVRAAQRLIDTEAPVIWEMLESVIEDKYILLNRQPTLHRQSIMAFKPILVEGLAIELHPLVCSPFNADFDGDAMTVHLPLSEEAQLEARKIMVPSKNIRTPASGDINISPAVQDILLGCYWATVVKENARGENRYFGSVSEAITAYDCGVVDLRAQVHVLASKKPTYGEYQGRTFETTVGRLLFNVRLPKDYPFVNETVTKKKLEFIIQDVIEKYGTEVLVQYLDPIKDFGFQYASKSGITFSWDDLKRPGNQEEKIQEGHQRSKDIVSDYESGYISLDERRRENITLWQGIKSDLIEQMEGAVHADSSIGNIIKSGARGSFNDLGEMITIFGVVQSASGEVIEQPIISSLKDGMSPIEYFNASFGARKGTTDTALKTGEAGYLSRKLFSVAQEIKIEGADCRTTRGFKIYRKPALEVGGVPFNERIRGRYSAEDVTGADGAVLVKKNQLIDSGIADLIQEHEQVDSIKIRSPITCQYTRGICMKCYGEDRSTGELVDIGEPVGTVAAQSVGEPGTQLTLRTFHAGAAAAGGDITTGLPRVTEVLERRSPKNPAPIARINGMVEKIDQHSDGSHTIYLNAGAKKASTADKAYTVPPYRFIEVQVGDEVQKGQFLADGPADLQVLLTYAGKERTQEYILKEIAKAYEMQGISIAPTHFEIIIRQMFSQMLVVAPGDGTHTAGELIELSELFESNDRLKEEGKELIKAEDVVSGITSVAVSRSNFLSAASFQNTTSVLIRAAIDGAKDMLDGVKENVIVGRLVPVGSGFEGSKKYMMVKEVRDDIARRLAEKEEKEAEK